MVTHQQEQSQYITVRECDEKQEKMWTAMKAAFASRAVQNILLVLLLSAFGYISVVQNKLSSISEELKSHVAAQAQYQASVDQMLQEMKVQIQANGAEYRQLLARIDEALRKKGG